VIVVVLALSAAMDLTGANIFQLTRHQQLVGGLISFWLHRLGTLYSILMPRYFGLFSPMTTYRLGAVNYPTIHIFESGTRYDSIAGVRHKNERVVGLSFWAHYSVRI